MRVGFSYFFMIIPSCSAPSMPASCIGAAKVVNLPKKSPPPSKAAGKRGLAWINQHMVNGRRKGWLRGPNSRFQPTAVKTADFEGMMQHKEC